jgi:hypothetical protein
MADEGVEPPLSGCKPDALPLHQSAGYRREELHLDLHLRRVVSYLLNDDGAFTATRSCCQRAVARERGGTAPPAVPSAQQRTKGVRQAWRLDWR